MSKPGAKPMRRLLCEILGPPSALRLVEGPTPEPRPDEACVEVAYAALNFFDTLMIEGKYQVRPPLPFSPAGEFSGRVSALGAGVAGLSVGQRVMGFCGHGAAAETIVVPAAALIPLPDALGDDRAAGLCVAYGTTMHALKQRAKIQRGETLAVLGASGGVGLAAVELGAALGARVIACASSDEKLAFARRMGAAETVNTRAQDLRVELKRLGGAKGIDVVYDPVGGALTEPALRSLGWGGRLLVIGFASGEIPKPPLNLALLKGCDILGVYWGDFALRESELNRANLAEIVAMAARGALSAHVHKAFALEDFAEAFGVISRREALGKVLLRIGAN